MKESTRNEPRHRAELLKRQQQEASIAFERLIADQSRADASYDQIPETFGGKVLGTDHARLMSPSYAAGVMGRLRFSDATAKPARQYIKGRLKRRLERPPSPTAHAAPALLITAGGSGAGKTTTLSAERVALYDAVYDTVLTSFGSAKKVINRAHRNGWRVDVHYVYRPFEHAVQGIIERTRQIGRAVSLINLPKVHLDAQQTVLRLQHRYVDDNAIQVAALLNAPGYPEVIELTRINPGGDLNYADTNYLQKVIDNALRQIKEDQTLDPLARAALSGGTVAA